VARSPALPYIAPFAAFLLLLALGSVWPLTGVADQLVRIAAVSAVLWFAARPALDFRTRSAVSSIAVGVLIFALWIAPDLLFPAYRHTLLFNNPLIGTVHSSLSTAERHDPAVLLLRTFRASVLVPIVEELFWRGWLQRALVAHDSPKSSGIDFRKVRLGTYTASSFWIVALLFATEHGPYWDVGLIAGVIFNLWMIRTRSLGDLILSHAVANLCLSAYVIAAGKWEYWL